MTKTILLVEDDPLVAMMLEGYLDALGHELVGPAESVATALNLIGTATFDGAIVDVHLANGEISAPVAAALKAAAKPFVVTTGHQVALDPAFDGAALLAKPFTLSSLETALLNLDQMSLGD